MRVEYEGTIDDRLAAHWRARGSFWWIGLGCVLICSYVCYFGTAYLWKFPEIAASSIAKAVAVSVAFVFGLAVAFLVMRFIRFLHRRSLRKMTHGAETFRVVMELTPRGVSIDDPSAHVFFDWTKIKGVYVRKKAVDIVTFHGFILWVPRREFESPEEETLFVETVKAYLAEEVRTHGVSGPDKHTKGSIEKR